ncbi:hypothetical protein C453_15078 [Haloferax elongans ATCC BAA-1513]|uniref:SCP2 domain-containing protein n=1 Tax=Haloferax elongans ATCC BAA-1513 TaxID=1230453 RepID=M0HH56_HALEO|nr:hypothetical protein [Haloferax elongans]ELZ82419.1 hypothetical protein C453_15078 [Haloferax elongans ATCC BAA-1513]
MSLSFRRFLVVILVVALTIPTGSVVAQESETPSDEEVLRLLENGVDLYNQNVDQFDVMFARDLIGGKTVNVYVEDGSETHVYSAVVADDMRIEEVALGPNPEASTRITTERAVLEEIADSPDPLGEVREALRDGRIRVNGEKGHPVDQAVWTVANLFKGFVL